MRKFLLWLLALVFMGFEGCSSRMKKIEEAIEAVIEHSDSVMEEEVLPVEEEEVEEETIEDEFFDDFIYEYATDSKFRLRRTKFPLAYYNGDEPLKLEEEEWLQDTLFLDDDVYTLIFDSEEDLDLESDTLLHSIQFEWIYFPDLRVKKYYFERVEGRWMLEAVNLRTLEAGENEDFVRFYGQFATDSLYQYQHLHDPLTYITVDPEDEFSIIETFIDVDQWQVFRPTLPEDRISNINFGQRNTESSVRKILKLNGVGNGYSNLLYFRKVRGEWELYKFEDTSA